MKRVFVSGASGNVGKLVVRNIIANEGLALAGGWCCEVGEDLGVLAGSGPSGVFASADLASGIRDSIPDVVVDFTSSTILMENLKIYAEIGIDAVIGTTGLSDEDMAKVEEMVKSRKLRWTVISNYGLGINLVMEFIKKARQFYPYAAITDRHHAQMSNAPSGTAATLANAASYGPKGEVASKETFPGVMGANIAGIPVTSQRLPYPGPYSEHEVTLARQDEIIRITVQDFSSDIYMDGVFLAVEKVGSLAPGTLVRTLAALE
ncbi:MAG: 4-hydroxy-tetrahydrodipicolinate reductase [Thermovirgaceae bacterium]|nr:4-hydroxy-tetrahydrodipicolinate reductase [Thermovirgaceae bacterium]